jgi:hypothetical protein
MMALSEKTKKKLEDKSFIELFNDKKQKPKWVRLAENAYNYAKENMTHGKEPRLDDISAVLCPIIEVDDEFRKHQDEHGAREEEWVKWFTDYIVDQVIGDGRKHQ